MFGLACNAVVITIPGSFDTVTISCNYKLLIPYIDLIKYVSIYYMMYYNMF